MRKKVALLFLGCILVLFGLAWGGDSVGLWQFDLFFDGWWSLILIIMPIYGMIRHGVKGYDLLILFCGVVILLSHIGIIDWDRIRLLFWPAVVVLIGLYVIYSVFKKKPSARLEREAASMVSATFGSSRKSCDFQVYDGGRVDATFGAVELDLRNAIVERDIYMNVSVAFGSVKIWFPSNVRVVTDRSPAFGGVKNYVQDNNAVNVPVVHLRCSGAFGNIELY